MAEGKIIVLSIPDMSCAHCVKTINSSLSALAGVEDINIDLQGKKVQLRYYPDQISEQQIEAALDDAGYTVAS